MRSSLASLLSIIALITAAQAPKDTIVHVNVRSGFLVAIPETGQQIKWQVISGGGTKAASASYVLNGTVGQTAVGIGSSTTYRVNHGFWQNFPCCDKPGDANNDSAVNVGDAVYIINYIFKGGVAPVCKCEGDANGDCAINVGDAVYIINYIFKRGPPALCNLTCSICQ